MQQIDFLRRFGPSSPGFPDPVDVYDNQRNHIYSIAYGRSTPNQVKPKVKATPTKPIAWDMWYGCAALGSYNAKVIEHHKYGKCVMFLGEVPTILPNPNKNYWHVMDEMFLHCAESDTWAGSAGCLTIRKSEWKAFISLFKINECVKITIRGIM